MGITQASIYLLTLIVPALACVAPTALAPVAIAVPELEPVSPNAEILSLRSMGSDANLFMYGLQGTQSLTIPVPPG